MPASLTLPAREGPRRADGNRRRLRRQGRISVGDRRPRGAAGVEGRAAGEGRSTTARRRHGRRPPSATRRARGIARPLDARRKARWRWTSTSPSTAAPTATLSAVALSRGTIFTPAGPYMGSARNIVRVREAAPSRPTCAPPHGAFRGFGAPPEPVRAREPPHGSRSPRAIGLDARGASAAVISSA